MYDNRSFDRKFIVLTQESSGYAVDGQKLAGSVVLELRNGKGRITANVQGLKQITNAIYKVYLICSNDNETTGISAGVIEPDIKGKTSASLSFDPNGMYGSNIKYSDISIVAIMVRGINQAQNEIIAPLVGYTNGVVIWKSGFKEWKSSQEEDSYRAETTKEAVTVSEIESTCENDVPPDTETKEEIYDNSTEDSDTEILDTILPDSNGYTQIADENDGQVEQITEAVFGVMPYEDDESDGTIVDHTEPDENPKDSSLSNTLLPMAFYKYKEHVATNKKEVSFNEITASSAEEPPPNNHDSVFREKLREFVDNLSIDTNMDIKSVKPPEMMSDVYNEHDIEELFNNRPQMSPFAPHKSTQGAQDAFVTGKDKAVIKRGIPFKHIKWIRITQKDLYRLPRPIWKLADNPFVLLPYKRYNHYLLGISEHGKTKTFYFCVPGQYSVKDKYRANLLGFTEFLVIDGGPPREGVFGYWVMIV